jgi:catechol 2,3-dioxygenase-like lactoylglutathione lyase family enzyme
MLSASNVMAMVAVSDLAKGKEFYGGKLGLKSVGENEGGVAYKSGTGELFMYPAPSAGKNEATSVSWDVDDIESVVKDLSGKGISFEHYDMPYAKLEGDIHVMMDGMAKAAWFKDPDGNILGITQMSQDPAVGPAPN